MIFMAEEKEFNLAILENHLHDFMIENFVCLFNQSWRFFYVDPFVPLYPFEDSVFYMQPAQKITRINTTIGFNRLLNITAPITA